MAVELTFVRKGLIQGTWLDPLKSKSTLVPGRMRRTCLRQELPSRLDGNGQFSRDNKHTVRNYLWPIGFQVLHQGVAVYPHRLGTPGTR